MQWKTRTRLFDLTLRPLVMGIVNVTPDSFSDGGCYQGYEQAVAHAHRLVDEGADLLDIGGESTRPGSETISIQQELDRVIPVIEKLVCQVDIPLSIDTSKPEVAKVAIEAGVSVVNDITGGRQRAMREVCIAGGVGFCAMHMQGTPKTMQQSPDYSKEGGVEAAVGRFFREIKEQLVAEGMDGSFLCLDLGIGFGKTPADNMRLLACLREFSTIAPLLLGVSRKSFIGCFSGEKELLARDGYTALLSALGYAMGAGIHRVHNVKVVRHALEAFEAERKNDVL